MSETRSQVRGQRPFPLNSCRLTELQTSLLLSQDRSQSGASRAADEPSAFVTWQQWHKPEKGRITERRGAPPVRETSEGPNQEGKEMELRWWPHRCHQYHETKEHEPHRPDGSITRQLLQKNNQNLLLSWGTETLQPSHAPSAPQRSLTHNSCCLKKQRTNMDSDSCLVFFIQL